MRSGQATSIPQEGKCLKKNNEQFTSSASFSTSRSFFDTLEITNPTTMHMESACRSNSMQKTHCMDKEDVKKHYLENGISGISIRKVTF